MPLIFDLQTSDPTSLPQPSQIDLSHLVEDARSALVLAEFRLNAASRKAQSKESYQRIFAALQHTQIANSFLSE